MCFGFKLTRLKSIQFLSFFHKHFAGLVAKTDALTLQPEWREWSTGGLRRSVQPDHHRLHHSLMQLQ